MWNLVRSDRECREHTKLRTPEESCGDQSAIERVVEAVTYEHQHTRGMVAGVLVSVAGIWPLPVQRTSRGCVVSMLRTGGRSGAMHVGVGMPPEHQFLDHEEHPQPKHG